MEPPPEGLGALTLNTLIDTIQHIAAPRRYAVVKARTKKDKKMTLFEERGSDVIGVVRRRRTVKHGIYA